MPVAFDPSPAAVHSPVLANQGTARQTEEMARDYFNRSKPANPANRQPSLEPPPTQQSGSPMTQEDMRLHQASELVGPSRKPRDGSTSVSGSSNASPHVGNERTRQQFAGSPSLLQNASDGAIRNEPFKLQDVPKAKRSGGSTRSSRSEALSPKPLTPTVGTSINGGEVLETARDPSSTSTPLAEEPGSFDEKPHTSPVVAHDYYSREGASINSSRAKQKLVLGQVQYPPKRGDSLESSKQNQSIHRKDVSVGPSSSPRQNVATREASPSISTLLPGDLPKINGGKIISKPTESLDAKSIFDTSSPIPHRKDVSAAAHNVSFVAPRPPPVPPDTIRSRNESISTTQSETPRTGDIHNLPSLLRYSAGGEFTMDEDMARILGGGDVQNHESFLRRVSNSVRHGRSFSDKGMRFSKDRWPRSPGMNSMSTGQEISSPVSASPEHRDELSWFKNELRRERQKTVEREQKIAELEIALDSAANIKQVNTELREKRSTMVVLDTQKEIVVRELEVLTEHIAAAKKTRDPLDLGKMSNAALRDFAEALQQLKDSFAPQIEDSIQKRNELVDEISSLTQMKDKSFQEFEQLSLKNAQLADLNNQLVHQIQGIYKANSTSNVENSRGAANGLGIYSHSQDKSQISFDSRERSVANDASLTSSTTAVHQEEAEPVTVLQGPHVVNIRKGQPPKKFNWKKGGQNVAKGVTKGLKGAFSSTQQSYSREMQFAETAPYGTALPQQEYANISRNWNSEQPRPGFGFFNQRPVPKGSGPWKVHPDDSTHTLAADPSQCKDGIDRIAYSDVLMVYQHFSGRTLNRERSLKICLFRIL